jgi:hypothetical protein
LYGGYPTKFANSTQNPKKISEHQIYQSERKICMGTTRRSLQAQPRSAQNPKKMIGTPNQNEDFFNITMFSTLKEKSSQKLV